MNKAEDKIPKENVGLRASKSVKKPVPVKKGTTPSVFQRFWWIPAVFLSLFLSLTIAAVWRNYTAIQWVSYEDEIMKAQFPAAPEIGEEPAPYPFEMNMRTLASSSVKGVYKLYVFDLGVASKVSPLDALTSVRTAMVLYLGGKTVKETEQVIVIINKGNIFYCRQFLDSKGNIFFLVAGKSEPNEKEAEKWSQTDYTPPDAELFLNTFEAKAKLTNPAL